MVCTKGSRLNLGKSLPGPAPSRPSVSQCPRSAQRPLVAAGIGSPTFIPSMSLASWPGDPGREEWGEAGGAKEPRHPCLKTLGRAAAVEAKPAIGLWEPARRHGLVPAPQTPCCHPGCTSLQASCLVPPDSPSSVPCALDTSRPVHPVPVDPNFYAPRARKPPHSGCPAPRTPHVLIPHVLRSLYALHLAPWAPRPQTLYAHLCVPSTNALHVFTHCLWPLR